MTDDDIKRLKRLAEQATPGPWRVNMQGHSHHNVARVNGLEIAPPNSVELAHWTVDAAYIAAMSPSVTLALLREIERLRDELVNTRKSAFLEAARFCDELRHPDGMEYETRDWLLGTELCADGLRNVAMKEGK